MNATSTLLLTTLLACATLPAQDIQKAEDLARAWAPPRFKSVAEPKAEIRKGSGSKGADLEIIEVKVAADSQRSFANLHFALDRDMLEGAVTLRQLGEIAKAMNMAGRASFLIEGHTCDLGGDAHNRDLSWRRAQSVIAELTRLGVAADRLQAVGFGAEQPLVENTSEHARKQNRRVQIFRKL